MQLSEPRRHWQLSAIPLFGLSSAPILSFLTAMSRLRVGRPSGPGLRSAPSGWVGPRFGLPPQT